MTNARKVRPAGSGWYVVRRAAPDGLETADVVLCFAVDEPLVVGGDELRAVPASDPQFRGAAWWGPFRSRTEASRALAVARGDVS